MSLVPCSWEASPITPAHPLGRLLGRPGQVIAGDGSRSRRRSCRRRSCRCRGFLQRWEGASSSLNHPGSRGGRV